MSESNQQYKFLYPEFEGENGKEWLKDMLRHCVTAAHLRTWELIISFEGDHDEQLTMMDMVAEAAGCSVTKIDIDIQKMQELGLAIRRRTFERTYDFSGLYQLAHEYHEYLSSGKAISPDGKANAERILQDPELYQKLMRFQSYRKFLNKYTKKIGQVSFAEKPDL